MTDDNECLLVEAAVRNWCGLTHHHGCACHEKRRDEELDAVKTKLKIATDFVELIANRGAGPLAHRLEAQEVLGELK